MNEIYADTPVCKWQLTQAGLQSTDDITAKIAVYHVPFPYDQGHGKRFESRIDQSLIHSDYIIVLCSELHEKTADFIRRYQNPKIKFFLCGVVTGVESSDWMDWFITSSHFYKTNPLKVLDKLTPYQTKPKTFDILLGLPRPHRDIIYNYINLNNLNDQVLMTYLGHPWKITADQDHPGWIWEKEGIDTTGSDLHWSIAPIKYYGQNMSLSQIVPISIYNQTAFSIVAETNFASNYVFHTEKIVKPILARRLFIVFGGHHYLKNLQRLGFKTFDNIIDESYDNEPDFELRGKMICSQISYLLQQDQQRVLDAIRSIVEHNCQHMMITDWYGDFSREFQSLLLDHTRQN
jgi:hypothetical protein